MRLRLACAVLASLSVARVAGEGGDAGADGLDGEVASRLEEALRRRLTVVDVHAEHLDRLGRLPAVEIAGFRLKETIAISRGQPWAATRFFVPADYQARRRLQDVIPSVAETKFLMNSPQRRARLFAAMNAAAVQDAAWETPAGERWPGMAEAVYDSNADAILAQNLTKLREIVWPSTPPPKAGRRLRSPSDVYEAEQAAMKATGKALKEQLRKSASAKDYFGGKRSEACKDRKADSEMCVGDVAVAISVYENSDYRILLFHAGRTASEFQYILWYNKAHLLELFTEALYTMWSFNTRLPKTAEMLSRSGGLGVHGQEFVQRKEWLASEEHFKCALHWSHPEPMADVAAVAAWLRTSEEAVRTAGPWLLLKSLLRQILPSDRLRNEKDTWFTGTGTGGAHAALASTWLKEEDQVAYRTVVIAPTGWQCLARRYQTDMDPWQPWEGEPHITVYAHVLDAFANAMDPVAGRVCLYGLRDVRREGSPTREFCQEMIGHTGGALLLRGGGPEPTPEIARGREAFDACHYYTHSIWYAARLFQNDQTLSIDGATDGGCRIVDPVDQEDAFGRCPDESRAKLDCDYLLDPQQAVPVGSMVALAFTLTTCIGGFALAMWACTARVERNGWHVGMEDRSEGALMGGPMAEKLWKQAQAVARKVQERFGMSGEGRFDEMDEQVVPITSVTPETIGSARRDDPPPLEPEQPYARTVLEDGEGVPAAAEAAPSAPPVPKKKHRSDRRPKEDRKDKTDKVDKVDRRKQ